METLTQRRRNGHKDLKKRKEKSSQKNAKTRKKGHKRLKTEGNSLSKDTKKKSLWQHKDKQGKREIKTL